MKQYDPTWSSFASFACYVDIVSYDVVVINIRKFFSSETNPNESPYPLYIIRFKPWCNIFSLKSLVFKIAPFTTIITNKYNPNRGRGLSTKEKNSNGPLQCILIKSCTILFIFLRFRIVSLMIMHRAIWRSGFIN